MTSSNKHRIGSVVFGLLVGLAVMAWSYQWLVDPDKQIVRAKEEQIVQLSRTELERKLQLVGLEFVDPLAPQRKVGKVYIYPSADGWEVSGFYRRDENDRWHAYLMSIASDESLQSLKVQDRSDRLIELGAADPMLEVQP